MRPRITSLLVFPSVAEWHKQVARRRVGTANLYLQSLFTYWFNSIKSRGFKTVDQYVEEVKEQQRSDDVKVRRQWATDLLNWFDSYKSLRTKRPLTTDTRNVFVAAVKGFLVHHLGDVQEPSRWVLSTDEQVQAEELAKEEALPISLDEIRKLYRQCRTTRDRAIFLTLLNGFGISEFLQFSENWYKYHDGIEKKSVPVKVLIQRKKTGRIFNAYLWDDATNVLAELLEERRRELGRDLGPKDQLFVNKYGKPISDQVIFDLVRELADRSGVEPYEKGKVSFRVRPHEVGRDTFKTQCALARIPDDVSEYLLGHTIDPLDYNKFHRTPEGQKIILDGVSKLRPILNIVTGRGEEKTSGERECCRLASILAIQLHISEEEAHNRLLNDLYKNHRDVFQQVMVRIKAIPWSGDAKLAGEEGKGHYPHLQVLTREEHVKLAVDVAMTNGNGGKYEVRKVPADDVDAYSQAIAEGFEEAGKINGTIIMRKGVRT